LSRIYLLAIGCGMIYAFYLASQVQQEGEISAKLKKLENYVRHIYLIPDGLYQYVPVNQYQKLGKIDIRFFLSEERADEMFYFEYLTLNDGAYVVRYYYTPRKVTLEKFDQTKETQISEIQVIIEQFLGSQNRNLAKELLIENHIKTKRGDFIFFILNKIEINSRDFMPEDLNKERIFWQSFIYIQGDKVLGPSVEISKEDSETGGYKRTLWDVFSLNKKEYILIYKVIYESHNFEIFEKTNKGLRKVHEFCFGGL